MMKFIGLISFFILLSSGLKAPDLETVRLNYEKGIEDEKICNEMIAILEKEKGNSATLLAYLGGYQSMRATHVFNPISKLNTFKEGKKNIEQALVKAPNNVEIRFIRLSVQKKSPPFLGYNNRIQEDSDFIMKNKEKIQSEVLKKQVENLLKSD